MAFFTKYVIGAEEEHMSLIFIGMFVTSMAFYPLWRKIALRLGSKRTLALAVALFKESIAADKEGLLILTPQ